FDAERFLDEPTISWGGAPKLGGVRSVLLPALRMLYHLGVRHVFLLGVDFNMSQSSKYHFSQERTEASIAGNTRTYKHLTEYFSLLKPIFEKCDFKVYNCNEHSNLTVFPFIDFQAAVNMAR